jgi:hypothetical protein
MEVGVRKRERVSCRVIGLAVASLRRDAWWDFLGECENTVYSLNSRYRRLWLEQGLG